MKMEHLRLNRLAEYFGSILRPTSAGIALAALASFAVCNAANAQTTLWYVVINASATPPEIGVVPVNWSSPGWLHHAGPYYSAEAAWANACGMHTSKRYYSPDIAKGLVAC